MQFFSSHHHKLPSQLNGSLLRWFVRVSQRMLFKSYICHLLWRHTRFSILPSTLFRSLVVSQVDRRLRKLLWRQRVSKVLHLRWISSFSPVMVIYKETDVAWWQRPCLCSRRRRSGLYSRRAGGWYVPVCVCEKFNISFPIGAMFNSGQSCCAVEVRIVRWPFKVNPLTPRLAHLCAPIAIW